MAQKKASLTFPDEIKDKYYTTVVLSEDRKDDFQFLVASQLYGTFFGIYGQFIGKCNNGKATVEKIVFRIINYKGIVNLGIADIKFKPASKKIKFIITLRGLGSIVQNVTFKPDPGPLILNQKNEIVIERQLQSFIGSNDEIFSSGTFDEEFYFRDGLFPLSAPKAALEKMIDKIEREANGGIGSRCPKGLVRIICH